MRARRAISAIAGPFSHAARLFLSKATIELNAFLIESERGAERPASLESGKGWLAAERGWRSRLACQKIQLADDAGGGEGGAIVGHDSHSERVP
jgi:hypothetical protein